MIATYRYGGKILVKDQTGNHQEIAAPPASILAAHGPFLEVTITHPKEAQTKYQQAGQIAPAAPVKALIDTGAALSIITPDVARRVGLVQTGFRPITSVQDTQEQPVYFGFILFPWGAGKEIPIAACPLTNIDCLIGRDIIQHWHLSYNGPDGSIVICD